MQGLAACCANHGLLNASVLVISMSAKFEALEAEVLKLAPGEHSPLFERLAASLDTDAEIEAAWERAADRRQAEMESGSVAAIPGDEVFACAYARPVAGVSINRTFARSINPQRITLPG